MKTSADLAKHLAIVIVFAATLGQAVYAAWFKADGSDDVYAALRERVTENERYTLRLALELAEIRGRLSARMTTAAPSLAPDFPAPDGDDLVDELQAREDLPEQRVAR